MKKKGLGKWENSYAVEESYLFDNICMMEIPVGIVPSKTMQTYIKYISELIEFHYQ